MLFFYEDYSKIPCIYEIRNRHTNRSYIGQTIYLKKRWREHKESLLRNVHTNQFLQNDFNKCKEKLGNDNFLEFHVIESLSNIVDQKTLDNNELYWIKTYKEYYEIYNFIEENNGKPVYNEEYKQKLSAAKKLFYTTPAGQVCKQRMSEARKALFATPAGKALKKMQVRFLTINRGKTYEELYGPKKALEKKNKMSQAQKEKYSKLVNIKLVSPDGEIYTHIEGISLFARIHNIPASNLRAILSYRRKNCCGWHLLENIK
jgi:group I intron endonuclease